MRPRTIYATAVAVASWAGTLVAIATTPAYGCLTAWLSLVSVAAVGENTKGWTK